MIEGVAWSVMSGFGDAYLSPFALRLGAGNRAMAALGSMPLVIGALAQVAGAALAERFGRRKPLLVATTAAHAAAYVLLYAGAIATPARAVDWVLILGATLAWLGAFGTPAWTSWMGDVTSDHDRGRYLARRNSTVMIALTASMLLAASILSWFRQRGQVLFGFGVLFSVAALARALSSWLLSRHWEPPMVRSPEPGFSFWDFLRRAPRSNFVKFSLLVALMNGATNVAGPFFSVYMLRDLHWSYAQFTLNNVVQLLAQTAAYRWWGAVCDRHGSRVAIKAASVLLPALPLLWAITTDFRLLLAVQVLSGLSWAGFNLATTNFIYDAVTPAKRARVVGYHGLLNAAGTLIGANLIGAPLAELLPNEFAIGPWTVRLVSSLPLVFVASGLLRIAVAAVMLPRFREVRPVERVSTWTILRRFGSGEPVLTAGIDVIQRVPRLVRLGGRTGSRPPPPDHEPHETDHRHS
ncbi:MAG: MFS transporter [Kiritimatiellae bacterium]|nr:MFS transporter [Kiritimatiellia bacterium]